MIASRVDDDLSLQLLDPGHAGALFRLTDANRAYLRVWLPWLDQIRAVQDTRAFIDVARRQHANNDGFQTPMFFRGEMAGMIGHHGIDWPQASTSLGYWLSEDMQGRGIVTRACRAYVDHAFAELGLECVKIRCAVENVKSRAIPERLGFSEEGRMPKAEWLYDHFVDHVVYTMHASSWK